MSDTKLFAVTGKPIFFSKSPLLFKSLFHVAGIDAVYTRLAADSAEEAINTAKAMKLRGLNITAPFKEDMMNYLNRINKHAAKINAINCIVNKGNKYIGYNTDYIGVIKALKKNSFNPRNKIAVVLGAGGAARAAVYGLIQSDAKKVTILNRTEGKAREVSHQLGCDFAPLNKAKEILKQSELVVSCIPSYPHILDSFLQEKGTVVLDTNYKDLSPTHRFRDKGCRNINGLEWLIYQALPAFQLFTGQKASNDLDENLINDILIQKLINKSNIALIGFMGSGKTTVGKLLAKQMGYVFVDIDTIIEKSAGMTIPEIFSNRGERAFREIERVAIRKQIKDSRGKVFSLGGGAILKKGNCKIISSNCHAIWLWNSAQTAVKRIDLSSRPLLNQRNPVRSAETILAKRIPFYAKISDFIISTETGSAEKVVARITYEMDQTFKN